MTDRAEPGVARARYLRAVSDAATPRPGLVEALTFIADWAHDCATPEDTHGGYGFADIERMARAAIASGTGEPGLDADARTSLAAAVNYWIGRGDEHGALSHDEGWTIARSVVDGLVSGEVRHTTSIPRPGFRVEVRVARLANDKGADR